MLPPPQAPFLSELSGWVAANGGNIRHADHHSDAGTGLFLSRLEWDLEGFGLPREVIAPAVAALAAFQGAQPYQRAWERGVKLIGATAHFVTEELDGGLIIQ